jgi:hypothetical protein
MSYWIEKVKAQHVAEKISSELILGPGQSIMEIQTIESALGLRLPNELREFYQEVNGYGAPLSNSEDVDWLVVPLKDIAKTTKLAQDWFEETHPKEAGRFFAFIDWKCGDYSGYLVSESGKDCKFVTFSHEMYEFDPDQNPDDFFEISYDSFNEFLDID